MNITVLKEYVFIVISKDTTEKTYYYVSSRGYSDDKLLICTIVEM